MYRMSPFQTDASQELQITVSGTVYRISQVSLASFFVERNKSGRHSVNNPRHLSRNSSIRLAVVAAADPSNEALQTVDVASD